MPRTKRFIFASRANVPDVMVDVSGTSPIVYRIIVDHLGSPRFIINTADGVTALELDYDEWGNETVISGTRDLIPFGFAGGLYDDDTGLVRFGARDYDPEVGRWTIKDPIRFKGDSSNLFGYAMGDPQNLLDLNGKFPHFPVCISVAAVGAFSIHNIFSEMKSKIKDIKNEIERIDANLVNPDCPFDKGELKERKRSLEKQRNDLEAGFDRKEGIADAGIVSVIILCLFFPAV